jgi:hypothetical protein
MPRGKDLFDKRTPSAAHKGTRATAIDDLVIIPLEVRPAPLPSLCRHPAVDAPAIAAHDPLDFGAQQGQQSDRAALGVNHEAHHAGTGRRPQPTQLGPAFPTGLIGVLDRSDAHGLEGFWMRRCQRRAHFLFEVGDGAHRDRCLPDGGRDLFDPAVAAAVAAGEIRQRAAQAWSDAVRADFRRNRRTRHRATGGAGADRPWVFGDDRHHGGNSIV